MIDDDKDKVFYEVEALYKLDNAMRLWMGQEPIFKSQEDIIKEAVDSGEYVDPNEVLTLDDIINKTASLIKNKEPSGEDSKKE